MNVGDPPEEALLPVLDRAERGILGTDGRRHVVKSKNLRMVIPPK
jgi:hypothetical protein